MDLGSQHRLLKSLTHNQPSEASWGLTIVMMPWAQAWASPNFQPRGSLQELQWAEKHAK